MYFTPNFNRFDCYLKIKRFTSVGVILRFVKLEKKQFFNNRSRLLKIIISKTESLLSSITKIYDDRYYMFFEFLIVRCVGIIFSLDGTFTASTFSRIVIPFYITCSIINHFSIFIALSKL